VKAQSRIKLQLLSFLAIGFTIPFKALVDKVLAQPETSGEALKLYNQWFTQPIPPKGVNMQFPPGEDLLKLYASPNDRALQ
jgi:glutamate/aspartate transport system substrate-binding protein